MLNGIFNCKIIESSSVSHDNDSSWIRQNDFIKVNQFNIGYGINSAGYLYFDSLNHDEVPVTGIRINTQPYNNKNRVSQKRNYNKRVRLEEIELIKGKFIYSKKFWFDENYLLVEDMSSKIILTKIKNGMWQGAYIASWNGKRKNEASIYTMFLECSNDIDVLPAMIKSLY